jgi:ABC-type Fe3+-hydroxamate transport system substrate-binding protein
MYAPGTRRHIKAALDLGATPQEIMEVLKLCVVQGVQACNLCLTKSSASERSTSDKQLDRSGTSLRQFPPSRLVCLTEETVETLYLLDEQDLIVGVSGYAVRPPQVRREKPRVSAFTSADIPKILALEPDLVLTFSDLQAPIAAELIRAGVAVHAFNHRDIAGILAMIRTVGALVGAVDKAEGLARRYESRLDDVAALVRGRPKPKVYSRNGTIRSSAASAGCARIAPSRKSSPSSLPPRWTSKASPKLQWRRG